MDPCRPVMKESLQRTSLPADACPRAAAKGSTEWEVKEEVVTVVMADPDSTELEEGGGEGRLNVSLWWCWFWWLSSDEDDPEVVKWLGWKWKAEDAFIVSLFDGGNVGYEEKGQKKNKKKQTRHNPRSNLNWMMCQFESV